MRLLSELRRRNVLRMAALYIVAAWLVMQVAEVLIGLGVLPGRSGFWVFVALAVGFPIALVFSWLFEVTPEGVILEKDVSESHSITHVTGRRMDFVIIAILSAGLLLFALDKWWGTGPEELSIAVLPFENMSSDPEQEYFSDGISEEILNLLAQIEPLKVTARTSSFWFKGKDVKIADVASELNVRHVLEGSVRRSGDRVRITAQLIDAKDSSQLWSQTFDRDYSAEDLFYIQSEIARTITGRLRMTLTADDEERLARLPTENTEAYEAYLIGRDRLRDRKVSGLADAVEQFALAIELDPEFAGAYSGLVDACYLYKGYSGGHGNENCPSSPAELERLAHTAIELDPESGEAWISLGLARIEQSDDMPESMPKVREAIAAYERGLELNPNNSQGYHWYRMAMGRMFLYPDPPFGLIDAWQSGAWDWILDKGLEVDPLSVPLHYMKARYPGVARSKDEAIHHGRRLIEIAPDSPRGYETLGELAWKLSGRIDESIRWERKALEIDPQHAAFPRSMGRAYSALGDPDMALAYFELAKAITAPDNSFGQNWHLVQQSMIRLVSGLEDTRQMKERYAQLLSESGDNYGLSLGIFLDLAMEQSADALTRIQTFRPRCFSEKYVEQRYVHCPIELVRVYQELGDHTAAQDLVQGMVRYTEYLVNGIPVDRHRFFYASALAAEGRTAEALDILEKIVSSGWRGEYTDFLRYVLCCDVTFDAIRDDERFQAIVATIEADMAQQLENVREMERRGEVPTLEQVQALIASE